jgi:mRNA interferase YafQ
MKLKLTIVPTSQFKKDYKRIKKRGYDLKGLHGVLQKLANGAQLDEQNYDHALTGNYAGFRECHIRPDWLLIYAIDKGKLILTASRTGTHADLFNE